MYKKWLTWDIVKVEIKDFDGRLMWKSPRHADYYFFLAYFHIYFIELLNEILLVKFLIQW